jgi:NADH-quinone oxidoreductase subunit C
MSDFKVIADALKKNLEGGVLMVQEEGLYPFVLIKPAKVAQAAEYVKEMQNYDFLMYITAKDYPEGTEGNSEPHIVVIWHFFSYSRKTEFVMKTDIPRSGGIIPSVVYLYQAAEWLENEVYEMFGVTFEGHPNPRRMLLPEWFTGYPMLKDYENDDLEKIPTQ